MKGKFSLLRLYFTVISLASFIGLLIAYGIALQSYISKLIITDQEYIQGSYQNYTITSCEEPKYVGNTTKARTDKEIATCKEDAKKTVIDQRNYTTKQSIIGGLLRGTLALIVFLFHFPRFIKKDQE